MSDSPRWDAICTGMTDTLALLDGLRQLIRVLGLDTLVDAHELESGLMELEAECQRLAFDAHTAVVKRLPFCQAVLDFDNFPFLAWIHATVDDILTMSLPPELEAWVRNILSSPEPPSFEA